MPMKITDIAKFEEDNNLSINVYDFDDNDFAPLYISKFKSDIHIGLLLYKGHYSLIKNLDGLLRDQNKHHGKYFCPSCLFALKSSHERDEHFKKCRHNDHTAIKMPTANNNILEFNNVHRQQEAPLIIYADFECLTEKLKVSQQECESASYTNLYQRHTPCGFGLLPVTRSHGSIKYGELIIHRGKDTLDIFLKEVINLATNHHNNMAKPLKMEVKDWRSFKAAKTCHICSKPIFKNRVRDHCHISGKFRGAAHRHCNIALRLSKDVTVAMHNLRRYDGHIIMANIGKLCSERTDLEIEAVAKNMEDYLSFSLKVTSSNRKRRFDGQMVQQCYRIRFIDTCQFLPSSLENLVKNLEKNQFNAMRHHFSNSDIEKLTRKQIYPYDYMSCWDRFSELQLPDKSDFYNKLTQADVNNDDFEHAQHIWSHFKINNMGEYHDIYLKTDVLLLADVFESFRTSALQHYQLDPVHYITLPAFGLDAMLKKTGAKPELLTDPDMYAFFESGIRGGISVIGHRFAKANNKYLDDYDATKPSTYIIYLDVNNLYGKAMTENLPYNQFQWMTNEEIEDLNVMQISCNSKTGYILEVDLDYPTELHHLHNSYPLAAERVHVSDDMLSEYATRLKASKANVAKLVPNLMNKRKYIVHYRNLQIYLKYGMKLKKIHRGIKCHQSSWMKPYIDFNTIMRQKARNPFEKDFFKLLNNAVFGKTMENVRKYRDVKLVSRREKFLKLAANPRYLGSSAFANNLVAVHMLRRSTFLAKPIYSGFAILDLSKIYMIEFHHGYMLPKYGANRLKVLMTDTDSFINRVQTDDIYQDMAEDQDRFDFSNYPKKHPLFSTNNKQVLGKMKDETEGKPIKEFVGLRSKMYSFLCVDNEEKKRAKGVRKATLKKHIRHKDYFNTLHRRQTVRHLMYSLRNTKHQIYSVEQNKISLCAFDDKRYLLEDGKTSLAYGHFLIKEIEEGETADA